MLPWQFDQLTPAEFKAAVAGYERRQEREFERFAWLVMHMYAPHMRKGQKPPSVDKLLGRKPQPRD
jgi:hypothetical protein